MAWTYDTDLAEDKDRIRLYVGDTIEAIPLLSDEEIEAALELDADVFTCAANLCRALSARFGREASLETERIKDRKEAQAEHFLKLAEKYAAKAATQSSQAVWTGTYGEDSTDEPMFTRERHIV